MHSERQTGLPLCYVYAPCLCCCCLCIHTLLLLLSLYAPCLCCYVCTNLAVAVLLLLFVHKVRLLSEQLRDAQNMISIKDRSGGWRNPDADADVHVSGKEVVRKERRGLGTMPLVTECVVHDITWDLGPCMLAFTAKGLLCRVGQDRL